MKKKMTKCLCPLFLFLLAGLTAFAQEREVKGRIIDQASGAGLPGVTVTVRGSSVSTATDVNGQFNIRVPAAKATLQFTYVGYETVELKAGSGMMTVALKKADKSLDEVIVIGYGTVKKRDLTGAVSVVKANDIVRSPTSNPLEAIQGMVAGADITKTSGKAGAGVNIQVRGERTMTFSSPPLVIIDGMQGGDISVLNPNDVESIEVLKDASSTAIYGSQGANGVIIVTTKRGTAGKPKVSYNGYYGVNGWAQYPKPRTGDSYLNLRREAYKAAGKWSGPADDATIFSHDELTAINAGQWVDWVDALMHNGIRESHSVSVAGGSEKSKAYLSAGFFQDNGMIKSNNLTRYNVLLNLDQTINSWIKAGMQGALAYTNANTRGTDPFSLAATATPLGKPYDSLGHVNVYPVAGNSGLISPLSDDRGPYIATNNSVSTNINVNAHLDLEPIKGLTFRTAFGVTLVNTRVGQYYDSSSLEEVSKKVSYAAVSSGMTRFYNWDNILTYNKQIGDHSFTLTALTSYTRRNADTLVGAGTNLAFNSQLFYNLNGTETDNRTLLTSYTRQDNMSYGGRINYGYKGKYLLTLSERVDGASVLSAGHKWTSFPSIAGAWRIGDEKFMQHVNAISNLKLRLSYGVAGNSGIPPYYTQTYLINQAMGFENTPARAYIINSTIGNANLQWELSKTVDLGIDMGLFKNRVDVALDLYNTTTSKILLGRALPPSLGVSQIIQNVGTSQNRGVEVTINSRNIDGPAFKWYTTLNFMSNSEKITGLINGMNIYGADAENGSLLLGHPVHSFYNYKKTGIWQMNEQDKAGQLAFGNTPFKPGDIKLTDLNHDGKITPDSDRTYIGSTVPKWSMGFQNTFMYKGFDLTVYAIVRWGQMMKADFLGRYNPAGQGNNGPGYFDYWTPEHASNDYPSPYANESLSSVPGYTTLIDQDASYVKLKTVSLGYTLPPRLLKAAFMSTLRAYITCNNIFVKAKNHLIRDYDPERGGSEDAPLTRQLVVGLNVGF